MDKPRTRTEPAFRRNRGEPFEDFLLKRPLRILLPSIPLALCLSLTACAKKAAAPAAAKFQAMPVATVTVASVPVPISDEYVTTIKSRRSATLSPRVTGNLTAIMAHSGEYVRAGQPLMKIDPSQQEATVLAQEGTAQQMLATFDYNKTEIVRARKLYAAGVTSLDTLQQAEQAYASSKASYAAAQASVAAQKKLLGYYTIRAPFDGIVGDIPVHVGDYVTGSTVLTTVNEMRDLEAYIYVPADRAGQLRMGLPVEILNNNGQLLEKTAIDFIAPQVDDGLQGILVKAPVRPDDTALRNAQLVKARVIWSTASKPVIPVLAVTRLGGQAFVFTVGQRDGHDVAHQVAVTLGDPVGNDYAVLNGLKDGDKVIVSNTQFLVNGMPVHPLG